MANKTIGQIVNTMTSPSTSDLIPIWNDAQQRTDVIGRASLVGAVITGLGTIATGGHDLTVPASGTVDLLGVAQTITGVKTFTQPPKVPGGLDADVFSLDGSDNSVVVPAATAKLISTLALFSGLILVCEETAGTTAAFLCGGGLVAMIGTTNSGIWVANDNSTPNRIGVYHFGGFYFLINNFASSRTIKVMTLRIRAAT